MSEITESMLNALETVTSAYDSCALKYTESMYSGCGGTGCTNQCRASCSTTCSGKCEGAGYTRPHY